MNDYERRQIWTMRQLGEGYGTIANALNLSRETVKKFCSRHPELKGYGQATKQMFANSYYAYCLNCQIKLEHQNNGRPKKFCSTKCRKYYWDDHSDGHDRTKTAYHKKACHHCGRSFEFYSTAPRKFCSHECYIQSRFY